jgi:hypothetical protein
MKKEDWYGIVFRFGFVQLVNGITLILFYKAFFH